jgi:hypothetical protein
LKIKAFHISPRKNRTSILKHGLLTSSKTTGRIKYGPRIFFSTDVDNLGFDYVNFENVDCWEFEVDSKSIKKDLISNYKCHFYIENSILPSKITLKKSY